LVELPPVASYAALNLWNFTSSGSTFDDVDLLKALHTFTGTESESWFFVVSVALESLGARMIPKLVDAIVAIHSRDFDLITNVLEEFCHCVENMGHMLDRMHEKCDPTIFYNDIRPFLAGSKNMQAAGLPNGVFYDEGDGKGSWRQLRGGSNGQSSLIQFFDIALGVVHDSNGSGPTRGGNGGLSFHEEVRHYMPGPHRRFLEHVERMDSLRQLAFTHREGSDEHRRMQGAFEKATEFLAQFRNKHLAIVARYIVLPSQRPFRGKKANLASASAAGGDGDGCQAELTGTGGTALMPFLKQSRDETILAGRGPM
jgi:indoleamine 2,3-dioxygenase